VWWPNQNTRTRTKLNERRYTAMKYEKPVVAILASAAKAIQGGRKGSSSQTDMSFQQTIGAYEADE